MRLLRLDRSLRARRRGGFDHGEVRPASRLPSDAGRDRLQRSTVHAGAGNDRLELGLGPDLAYGEAGDDLVFGHGGDDDLRGGEGMDLLFPGTGTNRVDGGPGVDQADYNDFGEIAAGGNPSPGMRVTLASGDDAGEPRDGDRLVGVERVRGTEAGDVLVGSSSADELDGAGGGDVLRGGGGDDRLIADMTGIHIVNSRDVSSKRGVDVLSGGAGNDVIDLAHYIRRPAHVEADRISCGSGRDSVIGSWLSSARLPADCEQLCAPACAALAAVPYADVGITAVRPTSLLCRHAGGGRDERLGIVILGSA